MKRYDIVFEILHYMAVDSTLETIRYIARNIDTDDWLAVIVDNASPDGSGKVLDDTYKENEHFVVLHNSSNQGFTRGNNLGIDHIRENYEFDFMVVMNNDVMLIETAFLHKLRKYHDKYDFAVAGPNVVDTYGAVANPVARELPSDQLIRERMEGPRKVLKYDKFGLMRLYVFISYSGFRIKRFIRKETRKKYDRDVLRDVVLQGSFWVFSNSFFDVFPRLADKEYMYGEEETLQLCVSKKGLTSLYMPDIVVLHMHARATAAAYRNKSEMLRFSAYNKSNTWKEYVNLKEKLERDGVESS